MVAIQISGRITPSGKLEAELPPGLPPGDVEIIVQIPIEETWTDEELEEILRPVAPMTGSQIVEAGLLGGWADQGIGAGAEWVEEQRRKHREQTQW
jgi:hypothetical protein